MPGKDKAHPHVGKPPCGRKRAEQGASLSRPSDELSWKEALEIFLKKRGLKQSIQRQQLTEVILAQKGHFDIQELTAHVRKRFPSIGAATVYRNVKLLCDAGILRESLRDNLDRALYERAEEGHHDHIVCLDCGEIFEFEDEQMEHLQDRASERMNFKPLRHRHVIYAHCNLLSKKSAND